MKLDPSKDCPILIVMGQSNAHGHATRLSKELEINEGLRNVYGLSRVHNQAYGLEKVTWSHYTSHDMNLGEKQDHTWCLATEFARKWQSEIDNGAELPDLYVIQISIGAQGIHEHESICEGVNGDEPWNGLEMNMWYPNRPPVINIKDPSCPDISLYPLAVEILHLAMVSVREMGKRPVILGLHFNQWEEEAVTGGEAIEHAYENYSGIWDGFRAALGMDYPLYLYRPLSECEGYESPEAVRTLSDIFDRFAEERPDVRILDASKAAEVNSERNQYGIFMEDGVHYLPWVHKWFAQRQFADLELNCHE